MIKRWMNRIFSKQVEYVAYNSMVQGDDVALDIQTPPEEFRPQT